MSARLLRGQVYSFDSTTWSAKVLLEGSQGEVVVPVGEWIPAGMLAALDQVAVLLFDDSNPGDGVVLGPYGAVQAAWTLVGLNLGSASGAGTGDLNMSGDLTAGGDVIAARLIPGNDSGAVEYRNLLLSSGSATAVSATDKPFAFLFISETNGNPAIFALNGSANNVDELSDPNGVFGAAAGASSYNVYYSAGNSRYEIENTAGADRRFRIMVLTTASA
ncbi:MAG: hypothetical protein IT318_17310 [Anaerolineales bacterium]|nr:hypothetical protein [Anaerolineales bacterium]